MSTERELTALRQLIELRDVVLPTTSEYRGSLSLAIELLSDTRPAPEGVERAKAIEDAPRRVGRLTAAQADAIEQELREIEADPTKTKTYLRLYMQSCMPCGHAVGNLLTCSDPPHGCVICGEPNGVVEMVLCPVCKKEFDSVKSFWWGIDSNGNPTIENIACPYCPASTPAIPFDDFVSVNSLTSSASRDKVIEECISKLERIAGCLSDVQGEWASVDEAHLPNEMRRFRDLEVEVEQEIEAIRKLKQGEPT